jgi:spore maturation protein CgeB
MNALRDYEDYLSPEVMSAVVAADSVPVEQSRDKLPVLRVNNVQFHSSFSPIRDAERFVKRWIKSENVQDGVTVVMHGMGLGYYLEQLAAQLPESNIQVLLTDPSLLKTALEQRDLLSLLRDKRITLHLQVATLNSNQQLIHLRLPAWRKLYQEQCQLWDKELAAAGAEKKVSLRIQVISPIHGGSLPIARSVAAAFSELGHSTNLVDCSCFAAAREQLEQSVQDTNHESYLLGRMVELLSDYVLVEAERFQPQLIVVLAQAPLTAAALQELRRNGIRTVYWFVEDYERITYWQAIAPFYDLFCTIQTGEFHKQLQELGVKEPCYLPLAADVTQFHPLQPEAVEEQYCSELSFIGAGYHNREVFFLGLYGEDFKIWGAEWNPRHPLWKSVQNDAARTDSDQNLQIFNGTIFNLNLHSSSHLAGVDTQGDFVNPRVFDIAACGGFQLVDRRSLLGELFVEGEELVVYDDIKDLRSKLEYYRLHPAERNEIASAGYQRVLRDHTYARRMEQLLTEVARRYPELFKQAETPNSVATLRGELPDDKGWQDLLAGYRDDQELTLSQLDEDIRSGQEINSSAMVVMFAAEVERWARNKQLLPVSGGRPTS